MRGQEVSGPLEHFAFATCAVGDDQAFFHVVLGQLDGLFDRHGRYGQDQQVGAGHRVNQVPFSFFNGTQFLSPLARIRVQVVSNDLEFGFAPADGQAHAGTDQTQSDNRYACSCHRYLDFTSPVIGSQEGPFDSGRLACHQSSSAACNARNLRCAGAGRLSGAEGGRWWLRISAITSSLHAAARASSAPSSVWWASTWKA